MRSRSRRKREPQSPASPGPTPPARAPTDHDDALSPLEVRLSTMEWPKPPAGVRERLFEEIAARTEREQPATDVSGDTGVDGSGRGG